ncbi:hypothetical protein J6590_043841 [Homalodisca vitripennis]|nr:hypothetical protein J6590_043841 [Homalodisca vitripennis]
MGTSLLPVNKVRAIWLAVVVAFINAHLTCTGKNPGALRQMDNMAIFTCAGKMRINKRNHYRQPDSPDSNRKSKKDSISKFQLT